MTTFTIDPDNNITAHPSEAAAVSAASGESFSRHASRLVGGVRAGPKQPDTPNYPVAGIRWRYDVAAPEQEIADALRKGVFDTEDQRRMAARFRYSEAVFLHHRTQYVEAFAKLEETTALLTPLLQDRTPSVEDASLAYTASRWMVDLVPQHSGSTEFCDWMQRNAQYIAGSDPENRRLPTYSG